MKQFKRWMLGILLVVALVLVGCGGDAAVIDEATAGEAVTMTGKLNLNTAAGDEYLAAIPDFSNRMVREFEEYRPYISIQQFRREMGKYVDDATIATYEEYVFVPVDVDESDAETLMQIPGIDGALAAELMAARPFGSNDAFLTALGDSLSAEQVTTAASYLAGE